MANETSNETAAWRCIFERNLKFPVSRYKYYNPANGTRSVSFENRLLVGGFVRFRWTICFGFVGFVAGFGIVVLAVILDRISKTALARIDESREI